MDKKSKAALLREEYEEKLRQLQASCPHDQGVTGWIGTGEVTGPDLYGKNDAAVAHQYCKECAAVIHKMFFCAGCDCREHHDLVDDAAKIVDKKFWRFCAECAANPQHRLRESMFSQVWRTV